MPKKVKKGVPESKSKAKPERNKKEATIGDILDEPDTRKKQVKGKKGSESSDISKNETKNNDTKHLEEEEKKKKGKRSRKRMKRKKRRKTTEMPKRKVVKSILSLTKRFGDSMIISRRL